jgi:hypothetical protein
MAERVTCKCIPHQKTHLHAEVNQRRIWLENSEARAALWSGLRSTSDVRCKEHEHPYVKQKSQQ